MSKNKLIELNVDEINSLNDIEVELSETDRQILTDFRKAVKSWNESGKRVLEKAESVKTILDTFSPEVRTRWIYYAIAPVVVDFYETKGHKLTIDLGKSESGVVFRVEGVEDKAKAKNIQAGAANYLSYFLLTQAEKEALAQKKKAQAEARRLKELEALARSDAERKTQEENAKAIANAQASALAQAKADERVIDIDANIITPTQTPAPNTGGFDTIAKLTPQEETVEETETEDEPTDPFNTEIEASDALISEYQSLLKEVKAIPKSKLETAQNEDIKLSIQALKAILNYLK